MHAGATRGRVSTYVRAPPDHVGKGVPDVEITSACIPSTHAHRAPRRPLHMSPIQSESFSSLSLSTQSLSLPSLFFLTLTLSLCI